MDIKQLQDSRLNLLNQVDQIDQQITKIHNECKVDAADNLLKHLSIVTADEAYRLISLANLSCEELSEFNLLHVVFDKFSKDYDKDVFSKKVSELCDIGILTKRQMIKDKSLMNGREISKEQAKTSLSDDLFFMYSTTQKYTDLVQPFLTKTI